MPVYEADEGRRRAVQSQGLPGPRWRATTRTRRATCSRSRSTARPSIFYVNKDAFKKAGLDPNKAAEDLEGVPGRRRTSCKASGQSCVYTTAWPSWMHVENFSAWHNVPIGTKENGMAGLDTEFKINSPLHVRHARDAGRHGEEGRCSPTRAAATRRRPSSRAANARCSPSSHGRAGEHPAQRQVRVVRELHPVSRRREGRAAELHHRRRLALGDGRQDQQRLQGRGEVLRVPVAARTCRWTGTPARATCRSRWRPTSSRASRATTTRIPGADIAIKQLTNKPPTANSKGLRFGNFVQGREVIEEEMEARVRRQEGREDGAGRCREARQRDPAQVRGREQVASPLRGRP